MDRIEFEENFEELPSLHKAAFRQCKKSADRLPADGSIGSRSFSLGVDAFGAMAST